MNPEDIRQAVVASFQWTEAPLVGVIRKVLTFDRSRREQRNDR